MQITKEINSGCAHSSKPAEFWWEMKMSIWELSRFLTHHKTWKITKPWGKLRNNSGGMCGYGGKVFRVSQQGYKLRSIFIIHPQSQWLRISSLHTTAQPEDKVAKNFLMSIFYMCDGKIYCTKSLEAIYK